MMLYLGKPFTISDDGAKTKEQCFLCEQPELVISPELYMEIIGDNAVYFPRKSDDAIKPQIVDKKPKSDSLGFGVGFITGLMID